ncbi:MAG: NnrS family protein [Proteobacteria bacterium]|nr:NnrS family protein [Pseudomonadota bacterium]
MPIADDSAGLMRFQAPLWSSAFRPFFLFGIPFGIFVLMLGWLSAHTGVWAPPPWAGRLWHGHEMLFGFTAAIISGIILTALPSWAGTEEIKYRPLALLFCLWLAGRLAPVLHPLLAAILDCALFPVMAAMLAPQLLRVKNKLYLLVLPGLIGLASANVIFHYGLASGSEERAYFGLHLAVYTIFILYLLKSNVMIPVFTTNELRKRPEGGEVSRHAGLEVLAVLSVGVLAYADLAALPSAWIGWAAASACVINAARLLRWRGWRVAGAPIVFVMHLGIAWMVLALGLKAAAEFSAAVPKEAWLHAFTVGGIGLCMTVLMTRVVLRHTGRPLKLPAMIKFAYLLMFAAAILRLVWVLFALDIHVMSSSALLWVLAFLIYLLLFGPMLWRSSLPRQT